MKKGFFELNLFTGSVSAVILLVLVLGFYMVRANVMDKVKKSGETYVETSLERWKKGGMNAFSRVIPKDFEGSPADWNEMRLKDYFIDKVWVRSKYVSKKRYGIMYYFYQLSFSSFKVYAKVEITVEDGEGNLHTYNLIYSLESLQRNKWLVSRAPFKLFSLF